jgi:hypothetical protein
VGEGLGVLAEGAGVCEVAEVYWIYLNMAVKPDVDPHGVVLLTDATSRFHFHFVSFSILPSRQVMPTLELTGDVKCAVLNCIMKRQPFTP